MTALCHGKSTGGHYTVTSSIASRSIEVLAMPDTRPFVFVVDDDVSVGESLELLIESAGGQAETSRPRGNSSLARARLGHAVWYWTSRCRGSTDSSSSGSSPSAPTCLSCSSLGTATFRRPCRR
jgi:hypothetical protein